MAYDLNKLTRLRALQSLAEKVKAECASASELSELKTRVDNMATEGGEPNKLEGIKVNGKALAIAGKMVDILIATGQANGTIRVNGTDVSVAGLAALAYKSAISEAELSEALKSTINSKAAKATTLAGYGIADAYTKAQVDGIISAVYRPAGSAAFAALPTPAAGNLGRVYNVTDAFTTDSRFAEGPGKPYPAGTNVAVVQTDSGYQFDALSGMVDLSGYAKVADLEGKVDKVSGSRLMTSAEAAKLEGIAAGATKYVHPVHPARAVGLYKVKVDGQGHVTEASAVAKTDITALGIPAQDTTYAPATGSAAGLMSAADKVKLDGIAVAADTEVSAMLDEVFAPAQV